jgi:hypothetical protein
LEKKFHRQNILCTGSVARVVSHYSLLWVTAIVEREIASGGWLIFCHYCPFIVYFQSILLKEGWSAMKDRGNSKEIASLERSLFGGII